jgi:ComF family protein
MLRTALDVLSWLVSPERCAACDALVSFRTIFCPPCAAVAIAAQPMMSRGHGSLTSVAAPFLYGGSVSAAIGRFKYGPRVDLARPLGDLMRRVLPALAGLRFDCVVPVPLHEVRLAERGFNQAALLAAPLARSLGIECAARGLRRLRATLPQASLQRERREENVRGAFEARNVGLRGKRILLVDDVATTGKTFDACAAAALRGGARSVHAAALAKVI